MNQQKLTKFLKAYKKQKALNPPKVIIMKLTTNSKSFRMPIRITEEFVIKYRQAVRDGVDFEWVI